MSRQWPEINKIDFLKLFSPEYVPQKMQVGLSTEVFVTIHCDNFSPMDREIFRAILSYGDKSEVSGMVVSVLDRNELLTDAPEAEILLEEALHRFSHFSISVVFSENNVRYEDYHNNIFNVMMSSDAYGETTFITLGVKSLDVLEWLFERELIDLLNSNISVN